MDLFHFCSFASVDQLIKGFQRRAQLPPAPPACLTARRFWEVLGNSGKFWEVLAGFLADFVLLKPTRPQVKAW